MNEKTRRDITRAARFIARALALLYLPFAMYILLLSGYIALQDFKHAPGVFYPLNFLSAFMLTVGYVLLFWREMAGSRLVLIASVVLVILDSPVLLAPDAKVAAAMLRMSFLNTVCKLVIMLLPVIILYYCRQYGPHSN